MHSCRMRTVCCSGRLSCHARPCHTCPLPCTNPLPRMSPCHACSPVHTSLPCMPPCHTPLPCKPPATHAPYHAFHPLSCMTPNACPSLPCTPPLCHVHPTLLHHAFPPTDKMTDACENITFPQLLLRTVIIRHSNLIQKTFSCEKTKKFMYLKQTSSGHIMQTMTRAHMITADAMVTTGLMSNLNHLLSQPKLIL